MAEFRLFPVGISVEQLAIAWARTEAAPHGSAVMVDYEIGGRRRLGIPWKVPPIQSLACAVVIRPSVAPEDEAVLWAVGLVAAARASGVRPGWPDLLYDADGNEAGVVGLDVQLGPGVIHGAVISLRLDLNQLGIDLDARRDIAENFVVEVLRATSMVEDMRADLLTECAVLSAVIGKRVRATLLPNGHTRGTATAIDPAGSLVLKSPTGMLERLSPITVLRVDLV